MSNRRNLKDLPAAERELKVMEKCQELIGTLDLPAQMRVTNWLSAIAYDVPKMPAPGKVEDL